MLYYILNLIFIPWNNLDVAKAVIYSYIGFLYLVCVLFLIMSRSKKIRYLSFQYYFIYILILVGNVLFLFCLLWYAAFPLLILVTSITYRLMNKDLDKIRKEELLGGWCCNFKYRKQQIEDFKMKSAQEQQEYQEYCTSHPKKLKPLPLVIVSVILPIVITLCLWRSGIGYRLYGYPLVQPLYG